MGTYKDAGVDIDAGDHAVELMKASIAKASRPEVMGGIGGFAGLFDATALKSMKKPLLATSTDGVGTKTEIARAMGKYDTIGEDLVAMVVDDLVVCGAEPLFMTDYIAVGKVIPERIAEIVAGIARGCEKAHTALIGGETAEHPGLLDDDEFDIAGAATGVVDAGNQLGAELVKDGDILIAMPSSGFHATDLGWMIDASHNVKDPLEDLLQSVEAIMISYAQALLVDRVALNEAQQNNDVVAAQEILQNAFRTDVRAIVAEARLRAGAAINPLQFYRTQQIRNQLIHQRGNTIASGL